MFLAHLALFSFFDGMSDSGAPVGAGSLLSGDRNRLVRG
jgi:hypothetical protein